MEAWLLAHWPSLVQTLFSVGAIICAICKYGRNMINEIRAGFAQNTIDHAEFAAATKQNAATLDDHQQRIQRVEGHLMTGDRSESRSSH